MSNLTVTNVNGQNDLEGRTKAYCAINQVTTQVIEDSFNVSSIVDEGLGRTQSNITNAMSLSSYTVTGAYRSEFDNNDETYGTWTSACSHFSQDSSKVRSQANQTTVNNPLDVNHLTWAIFGDLA